MIKVTVRHPSSDYYSVVNVEDILRLIDKQIITWGIRFQELSMESKILKAEGKISKAESKKLKVEHDILLVDYYSGEAICNTQSVCEYLRLEENDAKRRSRKMYAKAKFIESRSKYWKALELFHQFPSFYVSGVFEDGYKRKSYSGLVRLILRIKNDYDGTIKDEIMYKAEAVGATHSWFNGLWPFDSINLLVMVDSDPENHELAFHQVADFYEKELGLKIDRKNSKINHTCHYGYAPSAFINPKCVPFHVDLDIKSHEIYHEANQSKMKGGIK